MMEFLQLPIQNLGLEHGDLAATLWFGVGLIAGLVLAIASIAGLAIECMTVEKSNLLQEDDMSRLTGIFVLVLRYARVLAGTRGRRRARAAAAGIQRRAEPRADTQLPPRRETDLVYGEGGGGAEVWVMEDFLPANLAGTSGGQ